MSSSPGDTPAHQAVWRQGTRPAPRHPATRDTATRPDEVFGTHTVGGRAAGSGDLSPQHLQLVAQHRDLHIPLVRGLAESDQTEDTPNDQEPNRARHHDRPSCQLPSPLVTAWTTPGMEIQE